MGRSRAGFGAWWWWGGGGVKGGMRGCVGSGPTGRVYSLLL